MKGALGLLLVEGLVVRDVQVARTACAELLGPGDLLCPWDDVGATAPIPARAQWHVLQPTALALIDARAVKVASNWPEIVTALCARGVLRAQTLAISLAIVCITGLKLRILLLMWHLADRWGTVTTEGVPLHVPLTHELVGRLVGASRPSGVDGPQGAP